MHSTPTSPCGASGTSGVLPSRDYVGGVPLVLRLDERDVLHPERRPNPAAFVLPRTTMLIAILRDALEVFAPYCAALHPQTTQTWFSYDGQPVCWTLPAGAIKDYVTEHRRLSAQTGAVSVGSVRYVDATALAESATAQPPADGAPALPLPAAAAAVAVPLVDTTALEPLELTFRIHQSPSSKLMQKNVPSLITFNRLDDYVRNEVKQLHKAAYTALYGSYKLYQNVPEALLLPAVGMSLYRPFEASDSDGAAPAATRFSSPYLLSEYSHLRTETLNRRATAFLVRLGFPAADAALLRDAGGEEAVPVLSFRAHRVPANAPHGATAADESDVTFGLLLWRLFRIPCLRWLAARAAAAATSEESCPPSAAAAGATYSGLIAALARRYYTDAPSSAVDALDEQNALSAITTSPAGEASGALPPFPWAVWEAAMVARLSADYDRWRGLPLLADGATAATAATEGTAAAALAVPHVTFEVQGTRPRLATPARFLETYLSSADRTIYITIRLTPPP